MDKDPNQTRFLRIERKLNWLLAIGLGQSVVLSFIVVWLIVSPFVPNFWTMIFLTLGLIGFLFIFRRRLPQWFGMLSRWVFSQIVAAEEKDAMK